MQIFSDSFFSQGSAHHICQDYALSGVNFAVLSDGCSSSPNTDIGARILAHAYAAKPQSLWDDCGFKIHSYLTAAGWARKTMGLSSQCLDATLALATFEDGMFRALQFGDGVVAARKHSGEISYQRVTFGGNAPYYPSYATNNGRVRAWANPDDPEAGACKVSRGTIDATGCVRDESEDIFCVTWEALCRNGNLVVNQVEVPASEYDLLMVLSDGAESFQDSSGYPVPFQSVIRELCAVKGLSGEFLKRRRKGFYQHCAQMGWSHWDDLSVAGVSVI